MHPRRPGRPPLDRSDRSVEMCLTLPSKRYDELYTRAVRARVSVPELVRRDLDRVEKPKVRENT
jgi:hypothetical protein